MLCIHAVMCCVLFVWDPGVVLLWGRGVRLHIYLSVETLIDERFSIRYFFHIGTR